MSPQRPVPSRFATELRRLREQAGYSLRDLAYRADLDPGYLSRLEHGWQKRPKPLHWQEAKPSRRALDDIAQALNAGGVTVEDTEQLYRELSLDPPRRVRETHDSNQLRGLPTAGGDLNDLSPEDVKALLLDLASRINPEQHDRGSGADRDGARSSGPAYGAAAG